MNGRVNMYFETQVDRHEKYIGISTIVGRSKRVVFSVCLDRIWKKTPTTTRFEKNIVLPLLIITKI